VPKYSNKISAIIFKKHHNGRPIFPLKKVYMLILVFFVLTALNYYAHCKDTEQEMTLENINVVLIDQKTVDSEKLNKEDVWNIARKTLDDIQFSLYSSSREEGIIVSLVRDFSMRMPQSGGRSDTSFPKSSPVEGDQYFLVIKIIADEVGKVVVDCAVAKRDRYSSDRSGRKILKKFINKLNDNLEKQLSYFRSCLLIP
jgi:hypothetical protein